jgi:hypothetical protein
MLANPYLSLAASLNAHFEKIKCDLCSSLLWSDLWHFCLNEAFVYKVLIYNIPK